MTNSLNVQTASFSRLHKKLVWPVDVATVQALAPADVDVLRKRVDESKARWAPLRSSPLSLAAGLSAAISLAVMHSPLAYAETVTGFVMGFAFVFVCAMFLCALSWVIIFQPAYSSTYWLDRALTPLSDSDSHCEEALELVRTWSSCSEYRDQVVGSGRALLEMDLGVLRELEKQGKAKQAEVSRHQACQSLHGLPA